jgi:hypothetical protein
LVGRTRGGQLKALCVRRFARGKLRLNLVARWGLGKWVIGSRVRAQERVSLTFDIAGFT